MHSRWAELQRRFASTMEAGSPNIGGREHLASSESGWALIALMIALTVLLMTLAAAAPSIYQEDRREREEELIFRGQEYARAIFNFQRTFRRYPTSINELIRTNNVRFLRHAYADPMSPNGHWRFIHVNGAGAVYDSRTQNLATGPGPLGGDTQGQSAQSQKSDDDSVGTNSDQKSSADQESKKRKKPPECDGKKWDPSEFTGSSSSSSFMTNSGTAGGGAFIVGVASCSDRESIRIWDKKHRYDEWEFLGSNFNAGVIGVPQQPQTPQGAQGSQQPGENAPPGTNPAPQPQPAQNPPQSTPSPPAGPGEGQPDQPPADLQQQ